ncbi:MAG: tyrosine-type recombinase/integrase, partial [Solirubrobacteraceae bacterium]
MWWVDKQRTVREATQKRHRWALEIHLLPFFGPMRLSEIKYATVRRYETLKLSEKDPLSPGSINKTVQLLAAILERAYREELIDRNPAKGDRLKVSKPTRAYLDHSDQIDALLRAAAALDAEARADRRGFARRAIVTTLLFTGVRVGELCSLRWRDIDLANARLRIATSKTDKGVRTID